MNKLYTIQEVASKLNLSDKTLRRWEEAGRFTPNRTLGNQRRYSIEDLQILDAIKHGTINEQNELLSLAQAAMLCGVTPTTIQRWENEGKIHPFITSGNTYYPKNRLLAKMPELKTNHLLAEESPPTSFEPKPPLETFQSKHTEQAAAFNEPQPQESTFDTTPVNPNLSHLPAPLTPTTPSLMQPTTSFNVQAAVFNVAITVVLILTYHFLFNTPSTQQVSPQPNQGSVQGASNTRDPSLELLKTMVDSTGGLTTTSLSSRVGLTSPLLTLSPNSAPTNPTPGTLYYDASSGTLRIFKTTGWQDLSPLNSYTVGDSQLVTGSGVLPKGQNQTSVTHDQITPTTPITVTFTSDYSPAKKYWVTPNQGSFTLSTDFPVTADATFYYHLITQASPGSAIIDP